MQPTATYEHWTVEGVEAVGAKAVCDTTPWHSHVHFIIGRIDAGTRLLQLRDRTVAVPAGAGFVLPPLLAHRMIASDAVDYRVLCFPPEAIRPAPACSCVFDTDWLRLFDRAYAVTLSGSSDGHEDLLAATRSLKFQQHGTPREPLPVQRLRREIAEDPERARTLSDMADAFDLSPFHLQRLFVRFTGLSPQQTQVLARLRRARALLLAGMPAGEVAVACGFADQSHLSREFRKWTGLPPGRYLAQLRRMKRS